MAFILKLEPLAFLILNYLQSLSPLLGNVDKSGRNAVISILKKTIIIIITMRSL